MSTEEGAQDILRAMDCEFSGAQGGVVCWLAEHFVQCRYCEQGRLGILGVLRILGKAQESV